MGLRKKKPQQFVEKHPQIFVEFSKDSTILFLTKDIYYPEQLNKIKDLISTVDMIKYKFTMLPSEFFKRIVRLDENGIKEVIYDDENNYNFIRNNKEVIINENKN